MFVVVKWSELLVSDDQEKKWLPDSNVEAGKDAGLGPSLRRAEAGARRCPRAFCERARTQTPGPGALHCSGLKYLAENGGTVSDGENIKCFGLNIKPNKGLEYSE